MPDKVAQKHVGKQHADDASRKQKTSASDEILAQLARDLTRSGPVDIASLILEERITNSVANELDKDVKHGKEKTRKQDSKRERRHSSAESELRSSNKSRKDSRKGKRDEAETDSRHSSPMARNGDENPSRSDRKKRKRSKEKKSRRSRSCSSSRRNDKKKKKERKSDPTWAVPAIPPPPNLRLTIGPSTSRVKDDDFPTYEFSEAAQHISDEDDDLPAGADFQTVKDEVDSLVQSTSASVATKAGEAKKNEPEQESFIGPQKPKEREKATKEEDPKPPEPEFFPLSKDRPRKRSPTPDFILQKAAEAQKKKEADAKKKEAKAKARDAPKVPVKPTTLLPRNINIQLKTKELPKPKDEEGNVEEKKDEKKLPSKRDRKSHKKSSHNSKEKDKHKSKDKEKRTAKSKDKDSSWRKRSEKDLEKLGEDAKRVLMSDGEVSSSDTYASDDEFKLRKESRLTANDAEKDRNSRWDEDRNGRDSPKRPRRSSADRHRRRSSPRRRSASPGSDDDRRRLIPGPWRRHLRGIVGGSKDANGHDERRSPPRRRSPSPRRPPRRRTPPRRFDKADYVDAHGNIDKKKLLEIAIANASKLGMEGKLPKGYEVISTIQNQSVQQLVDLCTRLQEETDKMERVSSDDDERYERWKDKHERKKREETGEEDEFSTRPIRAAKEIKFSLNLPDKKTLRQAFPVSSGTKHKDNSQWVPVEKEKPAEVVCPLTNALSKLKPNMPVPYKTLPQKPAPLDTSPMSLASTFANPTFMLPPPAPPKLSSAEGSTRLPLTETLGSLSASATSFLAPVAGHPPVPPPPASAMEAPIMAPPPLPPPPKPPVIRASFGRPSSVAAKAQQELAALPPPPAPPASTTAGPNPSATSTVPPPPTPPSTSNGGAIGPQMPWGAAGHEPVYPVKFPKPNPPLVLGNPVGAMSGLFQALPPTNITELVSQRAHFNERIRRNPNDVEARRKLKEIDEQACSFMSAWAENRNIPGIFQGAPAAPTASAPAAAPKQPAQPTQRFTPWATKDQLINAPQVSGGTGMRLLQKMGWRPGRGLGKQEDGQLEPLLLDVKADRRGLQSMEERRRSDLGLDVNGKNPISLLMEHCTRMQWEQPMFECEELGPPHNRQFLWRALLNGVEYEPACPSSNKKTGKAQVCMVALSALGALSHT